MKNTDKSKIQDQVEHLDLSELSTALRHVADAVEKLAASHQSDNPPDKGAAAEDNALEQWFLLNSHQHNHHK